MNHKFPIQTDLRGGPPRTASISGEYWEVALTKEELAEWDKYADWHGWLLSWSYERTLLMFLSHLRRGINLNRKLTA
jgi:hypothetical protein